MSCMILSAFVVGIIFSLCVIFRATMFGRSLRSVSPLFLPSEIGKWTLGDRFLRFSRLSLYLPSPFFETQALRCRIQMSSPQISLFLGVPL